VCFRAPSIGGSTGIRKRIILQYGNIWMTKIIPFAARLVAARNSKGLKQEQLAEKTGMKTAAISHFETGNRKPSLDNLRKLAEALNVTSDFLLGRTDDMTGYAQTEAVFRDGYNQLTDEQQEAANAMVRALAKLNEQKAKKQ